MSGTPLLSLPLEILQQVCEYLDVRRRKYLLSFALANKACLDAASECLFRTIRLNMSEARQLVADLERWTQILEQRSSFQYVRRIKIAEQQRPGSKDTRSDREPSAFELMDSEDEFMDPPAFPLAIPQRMQYDTFHEDDDDTAWPFLASFVAMTKNLADFHWDYRKPFPPCVLEALDRASIPCRLHLEQFWFCGYLKDDNRSPKELELLMSPRLHSIRTRSLGYTTNGHPDYSHDALFLLVDGMNPALQRISMVTDRNGWLDSGAWSVYAVKHRLPRPGFPGFILRDAAAVPSKRSRLTSIEIGGDMPVYLAAFEEFVQHCNCSMLKVLKLHVPITHRGLSLLTATQQFTSLSTLVLGAEKQPLDDDGEPLFEGDELGDETTAIAFIESLPPLSNIRLIGPLHESLFAAIVRRHGHSLQRLHLPAPDDQQHDQTEVFFTPDQVAHLAASCPVLEDLTITIPRSKGSEEEVAMYRSLGSMRRLQCLSLTLDCEDTSLNLCEQDADPTPARADFDAFDCELVAESTAGSREVCRGYIREAMMNRALDEKLARSIFATISDAKPFSSWPLERLGLRAVRGIYIGRLAGLMHLLGEWW